MAKKGTSAEDASKAAKLLAKKSTPKDVKSVAGSDLSQKQSKGKRKK